MAAKESLSLPELVSGAESAIRRVYEQSAQLEVGLVHRWGAAHTKITHLENQ